MTITIQENSMLPSNHELQVYQTMAASAVKSKVCKGSVEDMMMIMLAARELGMPPMMALNGGIHVIKEKVEISARFMAAAIRRKGHSITITEHTGTKCVIKGKRADNGDTFSSSFDNIDAGLAGLWGQGTWAKYPKDMLFARAMSRLARQLFADVIGTAYVEGEISYKEVTPDPEAMESVDVEIQQPESLLSLEDLYKRHPGEEQGVLEFIGSGMVHHNWTEQRMLNEYANKLEEFDRLYTLRKKRLNKNAI